MERLDYEREVEKEAKEFLSEHEDEIVELLTDSAKELSEELYESLNEDLDRSYTPEDATFVLENSENEETDSGLWEGVSDWREELNIRAAYTYINDVRSEIDYIYKQMYEDFESASADLNFDDEDYVEKLESLAKSILSEAVKEPIKQVEPGSEEEKEILSEWITLNKNVGERGGYPLGGSYIDARCGTGFGMPDQYEYVMTDRKVGKQLPHLAGKYRKDVQKYYQDTFGEIPATC